MSVRHCCTCARSLLSTESCLSSQCWCSSWYFICSHQTRDICEHGALATYWVLVIYGHAHTYTGTAGLVVFLTCLATLCRQAQMALHLENGVEMCIVLAPAQSAGSNCPTTDGCGWREQVPPRLWWMRPSQPRRPLSSCGMDLPPGVLKAESRQVTPSLLPARSDWSH